MAIAVGSGIYVKKIFKQHHSLVIVIPPAIARGLGVKRGDYLVLDPFMDKTHCVMFKWERKVESKNADFGRGDIEDQGGRLQPEGGA